MSKGKNPKKKTGNRAGVIAFGVTFAIFSSIFKLRGLLGVGLGLALSAFVSGVIRTMAQGLDLTTKNQQGQKSQKVDSLEKVQGDTGNPDVDALLQRGREIILEIRAENERIPDESLSDKLEQLEDRCAEVFRAVKDKPAKAPQIRKFMDYYLPTTLKMVKGYRTLGERNLNGSDVQAARRRIDDALGVVIKGCQKMLDNLYRDDVLDITTDIDVLEQMLKRDGLTESDLEKAAEQAKQAARIDAEAQARRQAAMARQAAQAAPAQQAQPSAQLAPSWQADSGVRKEVDEAMQQARQHIPQAPTLSGEMFPTYGGQAGATARADKPE